MSGKALETISATSSSVAKGTSEVSGDIAKTAKGAVQGAIAGAKELSCRQIKGQQEGGGADLPIGE